MHDLGYQQTVVSTRLQLLRSRSVDVSGSTEWTETVMPTSLAGTYPAPTEGRKLGECWPRRAEDSRMVRVARRPVQPLKGSDSLAMDRIMYGLPVLVRRRLLAAP
jgi:hypothetical protein